MGIAGEDKADGGESEIVENKSEAKQTNRSYSARTAFDISTNNLDSLDRIAINLSNGKTAYLFIPSPLPYGEKKRLQQFIDLLQEEMPSESAASHQRSDEEYGNEP